MSPARRTVQVAGWYEGLYALRSTMKTSVLLSSIFYIADSVVSGYYGIFFIADSVDLDTEKNKSDGLEKEKQAL